MYAFCVGYMAESMRKSESECRLPVKTIHPSTVETAPPADRRRC